MMITWCNFLTEDYATKLNYLFRDARFFLMKSNNAENISLAKNKGNQEIHKISL